MIDWVRPDFLDLNFGCPVNKVVCKNGGSSLLRDCPLLARVAAAVVRAADPVPVSAKIRIGWDHRSINAVTTAHSRGMRRLSHCGARPNEGARVFRTRRLVGDRRGRSRGRSSRHRQWRHCERRGSFDAARETGVAGIMIGRAAMASPWIFPRFALPWTPILPLPPPSLEEKWRLIRDHCSQEILWRRDERMAMKACGPGSWPTPRECPVVRGSAIQLAHVESLAEPRISPPHCPARPADPGSSGQQLTSQRPLELRRRLNQTEVLCCKGRIIKPTFSYATMIVAAYTLGGVGMTHKAFVCSTFQGSRNTAVRQSQACRRQAFSSSMEDWTAATG